MRDLKALEMGHHGTLVGDRMLRCYFVARGVKVSVSSCCDGADDGKVDVLLSSSDAVVVLEPLQAFGDESVGLSLILPGAVLVTNGSL